MGFIPNCILASSKKSTVICDCDLVLCTVSWLGVDVGYMVWSSSGNSVFTQMASYVSRTAAGYIRTLRHFLVDQILCQLLRIYPTLFSPLLTVSFHLEYSSLPSLPLDLGTVPYSHSFPKNRTGQLSYEKELGSGILKELLYTNNILGFFNYI